MPKLYNTFHNIQTIKSIIVEEYALARTERKQGQGYTGFVCYAEPDVTIEEDLLRRDLTINAMAKSIDGLN